MELPVRKKVIVGGISLTYEDYGYGEPIVFVHGIASSSYSWRDVAKKLSTSRRSICFDLMGFGYSDKPKNEVYTLDRQAELILGAINELGLERPILAGHSLGGGVCLAMMRQLGADQSSISGLVLVDTVCYLQKFPSFVRVLRIPILPFILMKLFPEEWLFSFAGRAIYQRKMKTDAINEYSNCLRTRGAHRALIATAKRLIPSNIDEFIASYSKISVPTQIIWGEQDHVIPLELGEKLSEDIGKSSPHVGFLTFEDCGHCPQEEYPKLVAEVIEEFTKVASLNNR
jgi:pimeloyl-ACP methyl ester carboxylesterase